MNLDFLSSIKIKNVYATLLSGTTVCGLTAVYGTKIYENSTCLGLTYLGINACAVDSAKLNNKSASYYLNTGSTALCATTAGNALALCGCVPASFLLSGGTAKNSTCLNGQLASYYMTATVGLTGATNGLGTTSQKICLGGALIAGTSITGNYALCLGTVASKLSAIDLHSAGNTTIVAGALLMSSSGATFTDLTLTTKQGIKYASDYSLTYDPRSLVDKGYVDSVATGLNIHQAVCAATTGPITLSGNQTIDGVLTTTGNRILVKNQAAGQDNGIYSANTSTWGRTSDYQTNVQVTNGDLIPVTSGSTQNSSIWALTTPEPITVGTTVLTFTEFSTVIDIQAGAGIAITQVGGIHTVCVLLGSNCGLSLAGTGLCVNSNIAGSCLSYSSGVLNVCASCFLGATACATDSAKFNNVLPAGYLLSGGTAVCATTAGNALSLGGALANTYASLASPNFTTCICTPVMCSTGVVKGTIISGSSCIESPVIRLTTGAAAGCVFTSNAGGCGVWCSPTTGNIVWSGTTANGVGTYYSSTCIKSQPNMTFDGTKLGVTGNICATTCLCGACTYGSTCVCTPYMCGATTYASTCVFSPISCGTTCVIGPIVLGSTCVCGAIVCSNTCILASTYICATTCLAGCSLIICNTSTGTDAIKICNTATNGRFWSVGDGAGSSPGIFGIYDNTGSALRFSINSTGVVCATNCFAGSGAGLTGTASSLTVGTATNALSLGGNLANTYAPLANPVFTCCISSCGTHKIGVYTYLGNLYSASDTWLGQNAYPNFETAVQIKLGSSYTASGAAILNVGFNGLKFYQWSPASISGCVANSVLTLPAPTLNIGADCNTCICGCLCLSSNGTAADWIATSDCRLKKCIKPIMDALSTVMQLEGVCYELCSDEKHLNQIGLIAQNVELVLPEVVSHGIPNEEDFKYGITDDKLGLKYDKITAVLIEAIKEQQKQIEKQDEQIACLRYDLNYWKNYNT